MAILSREQKETNALFQGYGEVYKVRAWNFWIRVNPDLPQFVHSFVYDFIRLVMQQGVSLTVTKRQKVVDYWRTELQQRPERYQDYMPEKVRIAQELTTHVQLKRKEVSQ